MKSSDELPNTRIWGDFSKVLFYKSVSSALQRYVYLCHCWNVMWVPDEVIMLLHDWKKGFLHIEIYLVSADSWSIDKISQEYHLNEQLQRNILKLVEKMNWQPKNLYKYIM